MKTWKVTTPALAKRGYYWNAGTKYGSIDFCTEELEPYFSIPEKTKHIWLMGSNRPSKESVPFFLFTRKGSDFVFWAKRKNLKNAGFFLGTDKWLVKNLPWHLAENNILKVWVTVEYE